LWIAYTLNDQVFVATTLGSDLDWSAPLVVPVAEGTTVRPDDIAGVQRLQGGIGVFWSNQLTDKFYFAVHRDGAPAADPAAWQLEIAAAGGRVADDHFNLKLASDGRLFAAVKTSHHTPSSALIGLLVRSPAGVWAPGAGHPGPAASGAPRRPARAPGLAGRQAAPGARRDRRRGPRAPARRDRAEGRRRAAGCDRAVVQLRLRAAPRRVEAV